MRDGREFDLRLVSLEVVAAEGEVGVAAWLGGRVRWSWTALGEAGLRVSTSVVIGGHVSEDIRQFVGADYWAEDCVHGAQICRRLLYPPWDAAG